MSETLVGRLRVGADEIDEANNLCWEASDEIERLRKALAEIADPSRALLTETIRWIARDALQDQQVEQSE